MGARRTLEERFWARVKKTDTCWLWQGPPDRWGYGRIQITENGKGRSALAHRVGYELQCGPLPAGQHGLHKCNQPLCVRAHPDHVYPGTDADNFADQVQAHHWHPCTPRPGELHHVAQLTEQKVRYMRDRHKHGATVADLAREMDVGYSAAYSAIQSITWRHIR